MEVLRRLPEGTQVRPPGLASTPFALSYVAVPASPWESSPLASAPSSSSLFLLLCFPCHGPVGLPCPWLSG